MLRNTGDKSYNCKFSVQKKSGGRNANAAGGRKKVPQPHASFMRTLFYAAAFTLRPTELSCVSTASGPPSVAFTKGDET